MSRSHRAAACGRGRGYSPRHVTIIWFGNDILACVACHQRINRGYQLRQKTTAPVRLLHQTPVTGVLEVPWGEEVKRQNHVPPTTDPWAASTTTAPFPPSSSSCWSMSDSGGLCGTCSMPLPASHHLKRTLAPRAAGSCHLPRQGPSPALRHSAGPPSQDRTGRWLV